jgi:hypothetical protein
VRGDLDEACVGERVDQPARGAVAFLGRELGGAGDGAEGDQLGEVAPRPRHQLT